VGGLRWRRGPPPRPRHNRADHGSHGSTHHARHRVSRYAGRSLASSYSRSLTPERCSGADGQWLVASDATGCSVVGRAAERDLSDLGAVQLVPESLTRLESRCSSYASRGWAGASVLSPPTGAVQVAAASHFGRWLRVYHDGDRLVHESGTLYPPTSIEYLSLECSSHALLAITEGSHLSVWDDREPRSCSQRFSTVRARGLASRARHRLPMVGR